MEDIEKAKNEFLKYANTFDTQDTQIVLKIKHPFRVMEYSRRIAEDLVLDEEQVNLAELIGLLHDIGRFEQRKNYKTYVDKLSVDHGDLGVEILESNNFIRNFVKNSKYDDIIKIAIKNHNKYKIEEGLNENALIQSKIIRDADKLDILYEAVEMFWSSDIDKENIENSYVSKEYLSQFENKAQIQRNEKVQTKLDGVISVLSFIFDVNFKYSLVYVREQNYVDKILDRFEFKNSSVREQIEKIRKISKEFLANK